MVKHQTHFSANGYLVQRFNPFSRSLRHFSSKMSEIRAIIPLVRISTFPAHIRWAWAWSCLLYTYSGGVPRRSRDLKITSTLYPGRATNVQTHCWACSSGFIITGDAKDPFSLPLGLWTNILSQPAIRKHKLNKLKRLQVIETLAFFSIDNRNLS